VTHYFAVVENVASVLSPALLNEARFQGAYRSFDRFTAACWIVSARVA
jgi:hypothetical protein